MASALFHGSYLQCASKTDRLSPHLWSYNWVTSYLESGDKHRCGFGKRCFCHLQMQMKTEALIGFCLGANSAAPSKMFLEFLPPFLSSKIMTNTFLRLS